jgi:hypothetical protein
MSKSVVIFIEDFKRFCKGMAEKWKAMEKVGYPKDYGTLSVATLGLGPIAAQGVELDTFLDDPMGLPDIEQSFDFPLGNPSLLESFMPLDSQSPLSEIKVPGKRDIQRPVPRVMSRKMTNQFPVSQRSSAQPKPLRQSIVQEDLKGIEIFFEEKGMPIREVKLLPSGTTRITLDELIGSPKVRQPEFVRVGSGK